MGTTRLQRLETCLKKDLSVLIPSLTEWDPILRHVRYSIVHVRLSADLRAAQVSIHFEAPEQEHLALLKALKGHSYAVQKKLASVVQMRFVPQLRFVPDRATAYNEKMQALFRAIAVDLE